MGIKRPRQQAEEPSGASHKKHKPDSKPFTRPHAHQHKKGSKPHHQSGPTKNPLAPLRNRIRSLKRLLAHDDAMDDDDASIRRGRHGVDDDTPLGPDGLHPSRSAAILHSTDELEVAAKAERRAAGKRKRLPANVRVEHERELAGLEEKVAEAERKRWRSEMVGRWHMVRFFERRRGDRRLRRARREVVELEAEAGDGEGLAEARRRVHVAEVDLNYALFWPLERAYVSLWPRKSGKDQEDGESDKGDEEARGDREMWALVERCMAEGTLEDLREGRIEGCGVERPKGNDKSGDGRGAKKEGGKKAQGVVGKQEGAVDEAEDSDDGFFE